VAVVAVAVATWAAVRGTQAAVEQVHMGRVRRPRLQRVPQRQWGATLHPLGQGSSFGRYARRAGAATKHRREWRGRQEGRIRRPSELRR